MHLNVQIMKRQPYITPISYPHEVEPDEDILTPHSWDYVTDDDDDDDDPATDPALTRKLHDYSVWDNVW